MIKKIILMTSLSLMASLSQAEDITSTLDIQVNVESYCEMSVGPEMKFGTISNTSQYTAANNTISVRCTKTTPYSIEIEPGAASTNDTTRFLVNDSGTNKIKYNLYQNWNGSSGKIWGLESTGNSKKSVATGNSETHTVTGVISKEQIYNPAGEYSEVVRVVIRY